MNRHQTGNICRLITVILVLLALAFFTSCTPRVVPSSDEVTTLAKIVPGADTSGHSKLIHIATGFMILAFLGCVVAAIATKAYKLFGTMAAGFLAGIIAAQTLAIIVPLLPYLALIAIAVFIGVLLWRLRKTWKVGVEGMRYAQEVTNELEKRNPQAAAKIKRKAMIHQARAGVWGEMDRLLHIPGVVRNPAKSKQTAMAEGMSNEYQ
jgi:hypothetical protein